MPEHRPPARLTPDEWRRVCAVLDRVHDAPAASRETVLADACREQGLAVGDVRRFVEAEARSDSLPELVPPQLIADAFSDEHGDDDARILRLEPGARLGPYEIGACIGTGGMGEVYRATDTRLDRTVAVKVLRPHVLQRPDARERFDREARAISSLNHPHVCTLHDVGHQDGVDFLVMEHVDGETLAARLRQGPLPLAQAVRFASQIADALDRAHRQGVVHRDLKPANIMITRAGVKLLDFGLALIDATGAPEARALAGTPEYMAPEQQRGRQADARSDIYACGAVLYEMITGRREPPTQGPFVPDAPASLDWTLSRCLAEDPDDRWQSAADLKHQLEWIASGPDVPTRDPSHGRWAAWLTVPILIALGVAGVWLWNQRASNAAPAATAVFAIEPPEGAVFDLTQALSPDGRRMAFTAREGATRELWVRSFDALAAQRIDGSEGAVHPFWSPDGRFVGFFADRKLKKVDLTSGAVHVICEAEGGGGGGTWNRDDVIVFSPAAGATTGLRRVAAAGGEPASLTEPASGLRIHAWPRFLPDGNRFIYTRAGASEGGIYAGRLDSSDAHVLVMPLATKAVIAGDVIFYLDDATLVAQRFDAARLAVDGEPVRVAEGVYVGSPGLAAFDASASGVITYRHAALVPRVQLTWLDRAGRTLEQLGRAGRYVTIRFSPDGRVVLAGSWNDGRRAAAGTVARIDAATGAETPAFTQASVPIWSPDGTRVIFTRFEPGRRLPTPVVAVLDGNAAERPLADFGAQAYAADWSRDGRFVVGTSLHADTGADIWVARADSGDPVRYLVSEPFHQYQPMISPDGRWMAYAGTDARGVPELYVRSFPDGGRLRRVSTRGGHSPRWRRDGRELYYVEPGGRLMTVPVAAGNDAFSPGAPEPLFQHEGFDGSPQAAFAGFAYDVSPNGTRFLVAVPTSDVEPPPPTIVMLNWAFPGSR